MKKLILSVCSFLCFSSAALQGGEILGLEWQYVGKNNELLRVQKEGTLTLVPRASGWRDDHPGWRNLNAAPMTSGEVYQVSFSARAARLKPAETAAFKLILNETNTSRRSAFFRCGPVVSAEWESFSVPFTVERNLQPKEMELVLVYGWGEGRIEIKDLQIESLGSGRPIQSFTRTGRWYGGQEQDAPWRQEAQARIERYRKGDFTVQVVDAQGAPVPGAQVLMEQTGHTYRFGVAVDSSLLRWMDPAAGENPELRSYFAWYRSEAKRGDLTFEQRQEEVRRYFEVLTNNFNYAVLENGMKWKAWAGEWADFDRESTLQTVDWLNAHGIQVKGHVLVWPGWENSPVYLKKLADRPDELKAEINRHIDEMGSTLNGKIVTMDTLNEPFNNHDYMDILGNQVMAEWFKRARTVLPDIQLNINDFLLIADGGRWTEKLDLYDNLIGNLIKEGAPLGGIGFQCHFRHTFLTEPERIWALCDRFARYGLPLSSSEFDVNIADEHLQAEYTRDFMTAWFAHPATTEFVQWGFWQGSHWLPYAALYDVDWRMKENMKVYRDLVFKQWWTARESASTGKDGKAALRGFFGQYRVTVTQNGRKRVVERVVFSKDNPQMTVELR